LIDLCLTRLAEDSIFSQISFRGVHSRHDLIYGYIYVNDVPENGLEPQSRQFFGDYKYFDFEFVSVKGDQDHEVLGPEPIIHSSAFNFQGSNTSRKIFRFR
jgi:hypothetical protein